MIGIAAAASGGLALAAMAGTGYQLTAARLVQRFVAQPSLAPLLCPPVTLLKPLCGAEPDLEDNLRSYCMQHYPHYQVVFGVHTADDPAWEVAESLRRLLPEVDITIVIGTGRPQDGNPKVANLVDMMSAARHPVLVLSDSDMAVGPDYLNNVVATLEQPGIGLATCLYVGRPDRSLWGRLGAMGINHNFLPAALVAQALGRKDGCFGATMALTRDTLDKIGGLESLRKQLADDYLLGAAVRALGQGIGLVPNLPHSIIHEPDFPTLFAHEIRWGRTLASIDRAGYMASVVTLAVPVAMLAVAVAIASPVGWAALALAMIGRVVAVRGQERALALDPQPIWLVLVRDLLSFAVQVVALSGRTVRWRGRRFRIGRRGTLVQHGESR